MPLDRIAVIGAGAWGTALAQAAALAGRQIMLCGREPAVAEEINTWHSNSVHLPGIELSSNILGASNYAAAIVADLIVLAVPAQATRSVLEGIDPAELANTPVVLTAKGLETGTLKRRSRDPSRDRPRRDPGTSSPARALPPMSPPVIPPR